MARLYRIANIGNLSGGDTFQHTMHVTAGDLITVADVVPVALTALGVFFTTAGNAAGRFHPQTVWSGVIVEEISLADGSVIDSLTGTASHPGTNPTNNPLPNECAIVCTFRTARLDDSGRGRWYLPPVCVDSLTATGRLNSTTLNAIVASVNAYIHALLTGTSVLTPVVWSRKLLQTNAITAWDLGDVVDAQRRRRNKLVESRTSGTVA